MRDGFVSLHRKLMLSDVWTASDTTLKVMIACLLMANWADQKWFNRSIRKPQLIPRGSFVTTQRAFCSACNMSRQNIRTAMHNLQAMQFLTQKVTGRITQITILKYNDYQNMPTQKVTRSSTIRQPLTNHSSTQLQEVKQREQREEGGTPVFSLSEFTAYWQSKPEYERDASKIAMGLKAYKLSFRVEEDIYNKIMGKGEENGAIRSQSISEQALERKRAQGLKGLRKDATAGEILAGIRGVQEVQPGNKTNP
jgi:hypothetical protein